MMTPGLAEGAGKTKVGEPVSLVKRKLGYEWLPEFSDRQVGFRASHNKWFCGVPGYYGTEDIPNGTEELLSAFLRERGDWAPNLYQSVPIRRLCGQAELSILKAGSAECVRMGSLALLDERCEGGSEGSSNATCRRSCNTQPLNAHSLFKALKQQVRQH